MRKLLLLLILLLTTSVYADTTPRILMISSDGFLDVGLSEPLTITFNLPMNQASVESGIHIDPETPVEFHWIDPDR